MDQRILIQRSTQHIRAAGEAVTKLEAAIAAQDWTQVAEQAKVLEAAGCHARRTAAKLGA